MTNYLQHQLDSRERHATQADARNAAQRFAEWAPTGNEPEPEIDLVEIGEGVFQVVEKRSDAHSLA